MKNNHNGSSSVGAILTMLFSTMLVISAAAQDGPPGPPPDGFGKSPQGRPLQPPPGGGAHSAYKLTGASTLNGGAATWKNRSFSSTNTDVSAVLVENGGDLMLINPAVTTSGNTSSQENSSFHGLNAGVLVTKGSKAVLTGGSIITSGTGANGLFATGAGAFAAMTSGTIKATGSGGHGVMTSAGGSLVIAQVDMLTTDIHGAAIATDRGGGTIAVTGGKIVTSGVDSPAVYSTGEITVSNADLTATGSEGAVIEGQNSIVLNNVRLRGAAKCGVMIYQSFSGDAQGRLGIFTMTGGSLAAATGPLFYVNNTKAVITLKDTEATATSAVLVNASAGRWGRSGSNGGNAIFTADGETLTGDLICDHISSITATLQKHTSLTGSINGAALTIDSTSRWNVTADSVLSSLTLPDGFSGDVIANISGNGHDVRYNAELAANQWLGGKTIALANGGRLLPATR